jgi:hypothetical protein
MIPWVSDLVQNAAHLVPGTAHPLSPDIAGAVAALDIPNPGQGTPPPGADKLETMLAWLAWIVFGLCVTGVLIVAGRMAIRHQKGEGGGHAASLVWVMTACVLAGSASLIVTQIVSLK